VSARQFELYIDELILDGFNVVDQHQLGMALQNELQRLFIKHGIPDSLQNNIRLNDLAGGSLSVASGDPTLIGTQTAERIYQGLHSMATTNNVPSTNK